MTRAQYFLQTIKDARRAAFKIGEPIFILDAPEHQDDPGVASPFLYCNEASLKIAFGRVKVAATISPWDGTIAFESGYTALFIQAERVQGRPLARERFGLDDSAFIL